MGDGASLYYFSARFFARSNLYLGLALLSQALTTLVAHGLQCPHTAFVARAPSLDALPNPGLFLSQSFVEQGVARFFFFKRLLFQLQIVCVVAGPTDDSAAINFHNTGRKFLQKRPIVSDKNNAAFVAANFVLEPLNGGDIQVVGRLIQ